MMFIIIVRNKLQKSTGCPKTSRNGLEVAKAGQIADRYNGQQA